MRVRLTAVSILLVALCAAAADPAATLVGEVLTRGTTYANLIELNDTIGGRPATSPAYARAVEFALRKFREYGYSDVKTESFSLRAGWQRGTARAEVLAPAKRTLHVVSVPWCRSTPAAGIEGELVDLGRGTEQDFITLDKKARGRIGLVRLSSLDSDLDKLLAENGQYGGIYLRAVQAGMAGLLLASPHPGNQYFALPLARDAQLTDIPVANIIRDDSYELSRLAAAGKPVRIRLVLENRTASAASDQNVIAELKGREHPEQIVVVGAHFDSWDLGNGALDNGVNAMSVIEVARAIKAAGLQPRATIRFVLFGAEELGMLGSREYVRAHTAELDRTRAAVIMDEGAGRVQGLSLGGRRDLEPRLRELLRPLENLGALNFTYEAFYGTDNFFFMTQGVPTIVAGQDLTDYVRHYHSNTDNVDRVDRREALLNSAIFAVTAFALGDAADPPGGRIPRDQVQQIFRENRLEIIE